MRTSYAVQTDALGDSSATNGTGSQRRFYLEDFNPLDLGTEPFASVKTPRFGPVYADGARRAGRVNAASISEAEHKALLRERQELLDKKLDGSMTKAQKNRLVYVRWSLDRIEDAKYGETLDRLDTVVSEYEQLLSAIHSLDDKLSREIPGKQRK